LASLPRIDPIFVGWDPWDLEAIKTAPPMSGVALTFASDEVTTEKSAIIGTDATWAAVLLRKGDLETMAVLRIEDSSCATRPSPSSTTWKRRASATDGIAPE
jgi:hypothetical protein